MVGKFKLECLLLICTYTNEKFVVICKPRTLNDGGDDSVKYRYRKKDRFLHCKKWRTHGTLKKTHAEHIICMCSNVTDIEHVLNVF